jgi:transcriptional regulator with XRE-family HTH domain
MTIGQMLLSLRKARQLSQEDLARLAGTSPVSVWGYEVGEMVPTLGNLMRLARALNVGLEAFNGCTPPLDNRNRRGPRRGACPRA